MRTHLDGLPKPAPEKTGWPWKIQEDWKEVVLENRSALPRITVITPSYNQGQFLEETIRSVLLQSYPNLEYMVIDGGSTDNSVDIIKKYSSKIDYWVSEPDRGQAHAINKGLARCTGDLVGWINSDDLLIPDALDILARKHIENPGMILLGDVYNFLDGSSWKQLIRQKNVTFKNLLIQEIRPIQWHQPGVYVPARLLSPDFYLDETLRYYFDQDWLCRLLQKSEVCYLNQPIAMFRFHQKSKTVGEKFSWLSERESMMKRYWDQIQDIDRDHILAFFELTRAAVSLGKAHWDRSAGKFHLQSAFRLYPKIALSPVFIEILMRSLLPHSLLLHLRSIFVNLHVRFHE